MKQSVTIYWFSNGVRVSHGTHEFENSSCVDCVKREFSSIDEALRDLKPTNRAVPILRYMKEQQE